MDLKKYINNKDYRINHFDYLKISNNNELNNLLEELKKNDINDDIFNLLKIIINKHNKFITGSLNNIIYNNNDLYKYDKLKLIEDKHIKNRNELFNKNKIELYTIIKDCIKDCIKNYDQQTQDILIKIINNTYIFDYFCGDIDLIIGPMFAGKTTELHRRYNIVKRKNKVLLITYIGDNRYTDNDYSVSHNDTKIQAIKCEYLKDVFNESINSDYIFIDEGQFFIDIYEFSEFMANNGKIVIISCLNGDINKNHMGDINNLYPIVRNITKLNSICNNCNKDGIYTFRHNCDNKEIKQIGYKEYITLCRKCYKDKIDF